VPADLRPVLKKYEQQRAAFVNEKAREAAAVRTQAAQDVERANAVIAQAAQWWQQTGPALQRAFANKWAQAGWQIAWWKARQRAEMERYKAGLEAQFHEYELQQLTALKGLDIATANGQASS
jgi:hypothetical protein